MSEDQRSLAGFPTGQTCFHKQGLIMQECFVGNFRTRCSKIQTCETEIFERRFRVSPSWPDYICGLLFGSGPAFIVTTSVFLPRRAIQLSFTMDRFQILYADDDPDDIFFTQRALMQASESCSIEVVSDGLFATEYLRGNGVYIDRRRYPLPELILTDLKMPRVSGLVLLRWIRQQAFLDSVPVILLSSGEAPWDIKAAYELGANGFIVKSSLSRQLSNCFKQLIKISRSGGHRLGGWLTVPGNQAAPMGEVQMFSFEAQLALTRKAPEGISRYNHQ